MNPDELTTTVWEIDEDAYPADESIEERARFLLRYAILAPSSHNAQPWRFTIDGPQIQVFADESRWLEVADHDRRELHLSLGCAVENLCVAAEHFGFGYRIQYPESRHRERRNHESQNNDFPNHMSQDHDSEEAGLETSDPVAVVTLQPDGDHSSDRPPGLFDQLTARYTSHALFDERPLPSHFRERLEQCVFEDDVSVFVIEDTDLKRSIGELQATADRIQMADPAYRKELGYWVGIGALGQSWLVARIAQAVVTRLDLGDRESQKNSKLIRHAPVIGVLVTETDDRPARVSAGQAYERIALVASADGIASHPLSQILEIPDKRDELATMLGISDSVPQHCFRLGYPDERRTHTPRWPLEAVVSTAA